MDPPPPREGAEYVSFVDSSITSIHVTQGGITERVMYNPRPASIKTFITQSDACKSDARLTQSRPLQVIIIGRKAVKYTTGEKGNARAETQEMVHRGFSPRSESTRQNAENKTGIRLVINQID